MSSIPPFVINNVHDIIILISLTTHINIKLMKQEIYKKQFSIGKIFSESWKHFTENFQSILMITLIVYIPINMILFFVPGGESLDDMRIYFRVIQLLEAFIGIIATMAIAYVIKAKIDGESINTDDALKKALSMWTKVVSTNILLGIFLFGLTLLLVIPGVIYYVYWVFTIYVVLFNGKTGKSAMDYSKGIVKNRWWRVAGYSFAFGILGFIVGITVGIPYWFLPENIITSVVSDTLIDIALSFFTVISIVFFVNFDATKK